MPQPAPRPVCSRRLHRWPLQRSLTLPVLLGALAAPPPATGAAAARAESCGPAASPVLQRADPLPSWREGSRKRALLPQGASALTQLLEASAAGLSPDAYEADVRAWLQRARHPQTGRPVMALVFQLMLELLQLLLALAGSIAGFSINRRGGWPVGRRPRDLLRSASAFTTGVFASLVMLVSVHSGLDAARTASSRLSTALTIHSGGGGGCARLDQPGPERRRRSAG